MSNRHLTAAATHDPLGLDSRQAGSRGPVPLDQDHDTAGPGQVHPPGEHALRLGERPEHVPAQYRVVRRRLEARGRGIAQQEGRTGDLGLACASIRGEKSTPSTAYPSALSRCARGPVPQPRSATRAGAGGSTPSRRSRQAARTLSSASPWSGSSSKLAASSSHISRVMHATPGPAVQARRAGHADGEGPTPALLDGPFRLAPRPDSNRRYRLERGIEGSSGDVAWTADQILTHARRDRTSSSRHEPCPQVIRGCRGSAARSGDVGQTPRDEDPPP